ncbi:MAG: glycerophosphodiester phosphodiesterase [Rhodocyclales bacterium]|nr:glycerophosphodiester phosphodiesterase [Rhodocyclales bacterium]
MRYPRIIAHRCGGALAPENTLAGLRIAARLGCRGVEFDAMLSRDGVPVLIHDETLERTTSGRGPVADLPVAQLRRFDAGSHRHPAFAGECLPTLAEALAVCNQLGLWANVEIKPSVGCDAETGAGVALVAREFADVVLSSFSPEALMNAASFAGELPRALLVESNSGDWFESLRRVDAKALHAAHQLLTVDSLRPLLEANFPVAAYTVNRRDEAERLFALGVAGVFTDRPDHWLAGEM